MMAGYLQFPFVVLVTTASWLAVTFLTSPEPQEKLADFYSRIRPGVTGWRPVIAAAEEAGETISSPVDGAKIAPGILASVIGCFMIYSAMFGTGYWLYGRYLWASVFTVAAVIMAFALARVWRVLRMRSFVNSES